MRACEREGGRERYGRRVREERERERGVPGKEGGTGGREREGDGEGGS